MSDCIDCQSSSGAIADWLWQVARFGNELAKHVVNGMPEATDELKKARLDVCSRCEFLNVNTCRVCDCFIPLKASWLDTDCPKGKWLVDEKIQQIMDEDSVD